MNDQITEVVALEECVGQVPAPLDMKVIDHVDETSRRWLALSPLAFLAFGVDIMAAVVEPGLAEPPEPPTARGR